MTNIAKSQSQNIFSPNGNSLAVFIDGITGQLMLKDVVGVVEPISNYIKTPIGSSPFEFNQNQTGIQPVLGGNSSIGAYSSILGGIYNNNTGCFSSIIGGQGNYISTNGYYSVISGGQYNTSSDYWAVVSGGNVNLASAASSVVSGGTSNIASGRRSSVIGGFTNTASGYSSSVLGGRFNISSNCYSISSGSFNCSTGVRSMVLGGYGNVSSSQNSFVVGGRCNTASSKMSMVIGGKCNISNGSYSTILSGCNNNICGFSNSNIIGSNLCATQDCTTFTNCLSANNLTIGCSVCVGTNKVIVNKQAQIGSFFSTQNQCATAINTPTIMTLNNTDSFSNGISVISNSRITVTEKGIYNLQFSAQIDRVLNSGVDDMTIWLKKQGLDVPDSSTTVVVSGNANKAKVAASWNFFVSLEANQYVELAFSVTTLDIQIIYQSENLTVPYPAIPSLIVTINKLN